MVDVAKQARVVAVVHATGIHVDIAIGCMPFEVELVHRSEIHRVADLGVRLPTVEDLIILKAIASRPKDLEDIRTVASIYTDLDRDRIRHWVTEYGDLLDEPDLWNRVEPLLTSP
jgi:predicted nucleotidyltransferase